MTYMLRDRPDGQVEIVLMKPILVGLFPERDIAIRVCAFLKDEAAEWPEDAPATFARAAADAAEAEADDLADLMPPQAAPPQAVAAVRNLPALVPSRPRPPAILTPAAPKLTEAQRSAAFRRIVEGEKIAAVAPDFGLTMGQLRGIWAAHKSAMQRHFAEGGQVACKHCSLPFMPSLSQPETCARCSHE